MDKQIEMLAFRTELKYTNEAENGIRRPLFRRLSSSIVSLLDEKRCKNTNKILGIKLA